LKFSWRIALGFALSAALLYWALRDTDWSLFASDMRASNPLYWGLAVLVSMATFPLRARRWRIILAPVEPNLPFGPLWRSIAVGMMANNVLPGRIGEIIRAYALNREVPRIPFTTSLASLVVDRTFDAVIVLALLVVAMLDPAFSTTTNLEDKTVGSVVVAVAAIVVGAFAALYFAVFMPARVESIVTAVVRRIFPRAESRVRDLVHSFVAGLGVLRHPARFAAVIWWTLLHWLANATAFWLGFKAVGLDVPFTGALFVQGIIVMGVALPSGPGFVGIFEAAAKVALALYGISASSALAWALGYHVLTFIPITVIGFWYAGRLGLSLGDLQKTEAPLKS
jgi:glycosyltransferase 2 family protein